DLWPTIKQLCHLPLLEDWQATLQPQLRACINVLPSVGVHAYQLDLPIEPIETLVSEAMQQGLLPVTEDAM
ncbi:hypothetical protein BTO01_28905, partial [Vibrio jasicida]